MSYRVSFLPKKKKFHWNVQVGESINYIFDRIVVFEQILYNSPVGLSGLNYELDQFKARVDVRVICAPDDSLKVSQRRILDILDKIPVHNAAHGFVRGRDALSCSGAHTAYWGRNAQLVLLNLDLKNFFHSVSGPFVKKTLKAHKITEENCRQILDTCTIKADTTLCIEILRGLNSLHNRYERVNADSKLGKTFEKVIKLMEESKHPSCKEISFMICKKILGLGPAIDQKTAFLPQGSPASPFLSNLSMKLIDIRFNALARSMGAFYTRYADDLTFSWRTPTKKKRINSVLNLIKVILKENDLEVHPLKQRIVGAGNKQDIVGYCINSGRPTVSRKYRRNVRSALFNESRQRRLEDNKNGVKFYEKTDPDHSRKRFDYLGGIISHIRTTRPEQAIILRKQLEHIKEGPVRTINVEKITTEVAITIPDDNFSMIIPVE